VSTLRKGSRIPRSMEFVASLWMIATYRKRIREKLSYLRQIISSPASSDRVGREGGKLICRGPQVRTRLIHTPGRISPMPRDWKAIADRIMSEGAIPVSKAAKLIVAEKGRIHPYPSSSTLVRWIVRGKRGCFLDGCQLSGETWFTSKQALVRFAAGLSEIG